MRLVWTRPLAPGDQALLESLDVEFLALPLIKTEFLELADDQLQVLASFDDPLFLFTSRRGVDSLWRWPAIRQILLVESVATVGAATARHCERLGIKVLSGPENFGAKDLERWISTNVPTSRPLVCPGPVVRGYPLAEHLGSAGFSVHTVNTYQTKPERVTEPVSLADDDVVVFCSPSAIVSFFDVNKEKTRGLRPSKFLALGQQVAANLRGRSLEDIIVIKELSYRELKGALAQHGLKG